jgi:hypothetical protein
LHVFPDHCPRPLETQKSRFFKVSAVSGGNNPQPPAPGTRVAGRTARGRDCELLDCSGDGLPRRELERLLAELIAADAFGFRARGGAGAVPIGQPEYAHVQIGERLYRLIVDRQTARLERF